MTIYLAHNLVAATHLTKEIVPLLTGMGHEITSSWIYGDKSTSQKEVAEQDLSDLIAADVIIHFADQYGESPGRGKYVELGFAYAISKRIIVVGAACESCVFYFLKGIERFHNIDELVYYLKTR